jgi:UDP-3-O-[3-hydroxymyristoyl] glucosamine N-acyltransferase
MNMTLAETAALCGGELEGDAQLRVTALAPVENAPEGSLSYLADFKKIKLLEGCKAACVILPADAKGKPRPFAGAAIYAKEPHWAFTLVMRRIFGDTAPKRELGIHPTATVHPSAKIGGKVSIGANVVIAAGASVDYGTDIHPNCVVEQNASIGKHCTLYPGVVVRYDCVLGDNVIIHPNSVIGADGFGYIFRGGVHEKIPQLGRVVIESDVEIGALTAVDRAMMAETRIGAGTKIDNLVQIAHNVKTGRACIIISQTGISGSCELGDGVVLAGQVGMADHVKIGSGAVLAARCGVMSDIEPGAVMFGTPARPHMQGLKIQALMAKLPEMHADIKELKKKLENR